MLLLEQVGSTLQEQVNTFADDELGKLVSAINLKFSSL